MYEKEMDSTTLSIFGLREEDMEEINTIEVYPDNWCSFLLFDFLATQWRTSAGGVIGLDYNVIPLAFDMLEVEEDSRQDAVLGLRVMESTAIRVMNEK